MLDNCTVPEYEFRNFYVARLEAECKALAPVAPLQPMLTAARGVYDDIDPFVLFRGDWDRSDGFDDAYQKTVAYTDTAGAEAAFAFEGDAMTYVYTKAPNRGIATITIDGVPKGRFDLYSTTIQWQSRLRFDGLGPGRHVFVMHVTGESRPGARGHLRRSGRARRFTSKFRIAAGSGKHTIMFNTACSPRTSLQSPIPPSASSWKRSWSTGFFPAPDGWRDFCA